MDPEDDSRLLPDPAGRPGAVVQLCEGEVRAIIGFIKDPCDRAETLAMLREAGWPAATELIEELAADVFRRDLKIQVLSDVAAVLGLERDQRFVHAVLSRVRREDRYNILNDEVLATADILEHDRGLLMHLLDGCLEAAVFEATPPHRPDAAVSCLGAWLSEVAPIVLPDPLVRMDWFLTRFCAPLSICHYAEEMWGVSEAVLEWIQSVSGPEERRRLFELLDGRRAVWMPVIGDEWMTTEVELMRSEFRPDEDDDSEA